MATRLVTIVVLSATFALCWGCISDEANRYYGQVTYPPRSPEEVQVLFDEPPQPYVVIADFQARSATIEHMRKRAAEIGADAVIIVPTGGLYSQSEVWADRDRHRSTHTRLLGTAIKFR